MGWNIYQATDSVRGDEVLGDGLLAVNEETGAYKIGDGETAADDLQSYGGSTPVGALVTTATAIGTAAKTTTSSEPPANTLVPVKFTAGNSAASATLAFDGGTARKFALAGDDTVAAADLTVAENGVVVCYFDGTLLHLLGSQAAEVDT